MVKRKSFGIKIIGKPIQFNYEQYAVIKTEMGYYARIKGKGHLATGNRYNTAQGAKKELMMKLKHAKLFMKEEKTK